MSDGRVEVEAVLNEAPLKKGVASVKADIKSIEDADRKLDWSGLQKGADAAKQFGDKLTSAGQALPSSSRRRCSRLASHARQ